MLLKLYLLKSNGHVLSDLLKYEISFLCIYLRFYCVYNFEIAYYWLSKTVAEYLKEYSDFLGSRAFLSNSEIVEM